MKNFINITLILFLLFAVSACQQLKPEEGFEFSELSEDELSEIPDFALLSFKPEAELTEFPEITVQSHRPKLLLVRKGETWKLWKNIFRDCIKSEIFRKPVYLGTTNTLGLGTILDQNLQSACTTLKKGGFTDDEIKKIINEGAPASGQYKLKVDKNINLILGTESIDAVDVELSFILNKSKYFTVEIDEYKVDNLLTENLNQIIMASPENKPVYSSCLSKKGSKIMVNVVKISQFSALIESDKEISAGLKARLKDLENPIEADLKNGGRIGFRYVSDKTIEILNKGDFFAFGHFKKAEKL